MSINHRWKLWPFLELYLSKFAEAKFLLRPVKYHQIADNIQNSKKIMIIKLWKTWWSYHDQSMNHGKHGDHPTIMIWIVTSCYRTWQPGRHHGIMMFTFFAIMMIWSWRGDHVFFQPGYPLWKSHVTELRQRPKIDAVNSFWVFSFNTLFKSKNAHPLPATK